MKVPNYPKHIYLQGRNLGRNCSQKTKCERKNKRNRKSKKGNKAVNMKTRNINRIIKRNYNSNCENKQKKNNKKKERK